MDMGFAASAWRRSALGLVVAGLAASLFVLVESGKAPPVGIGQRAAPEIMRIRTVRMETTFPVAHWSISVAGREIAARFSDANAWEGVITAAAGAEVLIEARAADGAQRCALRIAMDGDAQRERLVWGVGGVIATVSIP